MTIKKQLDVAIKKLQTQYPAKLFRDKEFYCEWLAQTYFFVKHSTSLLGFAMPHLRDDALRHHFEHHLGEEERHDLVALKDLEKLGRDIKEFQESHQTQAFYQSQYYRIQFEGGTSLLGYILFLEGLAVAWGKDVYDEIKDLYKGSTLFIKVHAEEDPHHLDAAIETIMKLSKNEQEAILRNLEYSCDLYDKILQDVYGGKELKLAA